jgi:hypothetical protein
VPSIIAVTVVRPGMLITENPRALTKISRPEHHQP